MAIQIHTRMAKILQGEKVLLEAEPPAVGAGFKYVFKWQASQGELTTQSEDGSTAVFDTRGLPAGSYTVSVTATREGTPPAKAADLPAEDRGEIQVIVETRPASADQISTLLNNVATNITSGLQGVADAIHNAPNQPPRSATGQAETLFGRGGSDDGTPPAVRVSLQRRMPDETGSDLNVAFWQTIRNRTGAIAFRPYRRFINRVMCVDTSGPDARTRRQLNELRQSDLLFNGVDAYNLLRAATEAFLLLEAGVFVDPSDDSKVPDEESRLGRTVTYKEISGKLATYLGTGLPYLDNIVSSLDDTRVNPQAFPDCYYTVHDSRHRIILADGYRSPLLVELIWSYWHEESMLVQAINAISMRFQNRHVAGDRDPLAHLELDPLRPLNNLLWGYTQEEYRRLTIQRRAHEYDHEYGLTLYGRAVSPARSADSRSKFLEAFHNLLAACTSFYKQADDTTINADPFMLLSVLQEVHLILAEGAHNQFGDLPWTSRVEMLTQQWLMARPEMGEFLRGRIMVPYEEEWMGRVDTVKSLEGWGDTSVSYFHSLAVLGEQLLLSIRFTNWIGISDPETARNWALYWRPEIQGYAHNYRAVTGVDLTADSMVSQPAELRFARPSELLRQRLESGRNGRTPALPSAAPAALPQPQALPQGFRARRAQRRTLGTGGLAPNAGENENRG